MFFKGSLRTCFGSTFKLWSERKKKPRGKKKKEGRDREVHYSIEKKKKRTCTEHSKELGDHTRSGERTIMEILEINKVVDGRDTYRYGIFGRDHIKMEDIFQRIRLLLHKEALEEGITKFF